MSIETTLTLAVAIAILVGALVIRTVALGIFRLGMYLWVRLGGPAPVRREADVRDAIPTIPLRQRLAALGEGIAAAAIFVAASIARWFELMGYGLGWVLVRIARLSEAAWTWSAPRTARAAAGTRRGLAAASARLVAGSAWLAPRLVSSSRTTGRALKGAWALLVAALVSVVRGLRSTSYPGASTPQPARVIDVTDRPSSAGAAAQVGRARSAAGTRAGAA